MNKSQVDWDDIRETQSEHKPLIVSNLNEWNDEQIDIQPDPDESRRYVLCDMYTGGCGRGFAIGLKAHNSAQDYICDACRTKQTELRLLKEQLRAASRYAHTNTNCNLCAIQNQIDQVNGYDWREEVGCKTEAMMRPLERVMPGGAVY